MTQPSVLFCAAPKVSRADRHLQRRIGTVVLTPWSPGRSFAPVCSTCPKRCLRGPGCFLNPAYAALVGFGFATLPQGDAKGLVGIVICRAIAACTIRHSYRAVVSLSPA